MTIPATPPVTYQPRPAAPRPPRQSPVVAQIRDAPAPNPAIGHPLLAGNLLLATGSVLSTVGVDPTWCAGAGAASAVVAGAITRARWQHTPTTAFATAATAASGGWLWYAAEHTPWTAGSLGLLGAGLVTLGPLYGLVRWRHDTKTLKELEKRQAIRAEEKVDLWEGILHKAGAKDVRIMRDRSDDDWTRGERKFPAGFAMMLHLGDDAPDQRMIIGMTGDIERVARNRTRLPIRSGAIQMRPTGYPDELEMIVPTRDVLSETVPMPREEGLRSIADDLHVAMAVDGTPIGPNLIEDPHGMVSGMTNNGKSTFLNAHVAELTRCNDAIVWGICGFKPSRFFGPWMKPFLEGQVSRPPFDWVTGDIEEACKMLLDAYKLIDRRQEKAAETGEDKWHPRPGEPHVVIAIDESPDFLQNESYKVTTHRDEKVCFSELLLKVIRLGRSEGVHVVFLTQRGTSTMIGADGGDLKSQISYRSGFRATGFVELNAVFSTETAGIDLGQLPRGALYMEMGGFSRPVLCKAYYLSPEEISQVAVEHAPSRGPIDPWSAEVLDFYAERWTREEQIEFLRTVSTSMTQHVPDYCPQGATPLPPEKTATTEEREEFRSQIEGDWGEPQEDSPELAEDARRREIDILEEMYAAESEPEAPIPVVREDLDDDPRTVLEAIIATSIALTSETLIPTTDVTAAVVSHAPDWATGGEARRVAQALRLIGVTKVEPRPRYHGKRTECYRVDDLRQAVEDNVTSPEDQQ